MPKKLTSKESRDAAERFHDSYLKLHYEKKVWSKTEFSEKVGLGAASNLNRLLKNTEPSITQILLLAKEYNVSPMWILFGKGDFFMDEKTL